MNKKIFGALAALLILSSLSPICFAAPESQVTQDAVISAPQELVWFANRPVGHTAVNLGTYIPENIRSLDDDDFDIVIQYDWSVGDKESWNYTSKWDDYEKSPMFDMVGQDELFISEVFWLLYDETYAIFEDIAQLDEEDGTQVRYIDFSENPIYMRARYIAIPSEGDPVISDWSEIDAVIFDETATQSTEISPPVLSDLTVAEKEVSFKVTSEASFRHAVLLLKLMGMEDFSLKCTVICDTAEITATIPYAEGINTITLPEDFTLPQEGIITLNIDIISDVFDVASPQSVSVGSEVSSTPVSSEAPSEVSSSAENSGLNNTQIGAIVVGVVVLCIILAVVISSVGKKRRSHSAWH